MRLFEYGINRNFSILNLLLLSCTYMHDAGMVLRHDAGVTMWHDAGMVLRHDAGVAVWHDVGVAG